MKRGIARGAGQRFTVACNRTWGGHLATTRAARALDPQERLE